MGKEVDLCTECAAKLGEAYSLTKIAGGVDNKITCAHCRRRRFGATYKVAPRKRGGAT